MPDVTSTQSTPETLLDWLKVIAEPKRFQILELIIQGVQCNCELSEVLEVGPTLISHHMKALTQSGLVNIERDATDARWVYYSINLQALEELKSVFGSFFDPARIQPRRLTCGPGGQFIRLDDKLSVK